MSDAFRKHVTPGQTPQTEQARANQAQNSAGGYTFKVSDQTRINRFLTLGTDGGTYYATERKLTRDNASVIITAASNSDGLLLDETSEISTAGRAPRNNPALFALAAAAGLGNVKYRQRALDMLPEIARTGSHLLTWAEYIEMFRGWGPQLVKGVGKWYTCKHPEDLAYQLLKYKQRNGWSQRDLMRLSHFGRQSLTAEHKALFAYTMKGDFNAELLPPLIDLAERMHETRNVKVWTRGIAENRSLSWEMLPSEALAEPDVWVALIRNGNLPLTALMRNLARLTKLGVIAPFSENNKLITDKLTDAEYIVKSRIHPLSVLMALRTYTLGRSLKGKSQWVPVSPVADALDAMFYNSFGSIRPAGKRTAIAIDVSGSMAWNNFTRGHEVLYQDTALVPREIAAAVAMAVVRTEPEYAVIAFSHNFAPLDISPRQRLDDVIGTLSRMPAGGTDCAIPMLWATQNNLAVDTFQIHTDNETWYGATHPHEALNQYRKMSGISARLQVIASTATEFTIADPLDPGQLDVSGFDSAVPNLLADHSRGDV